MQRSVSEQASTGCPAILDELAVQRRVTNNLEVMVNAFHTSITELSDLQQFLSKQIIALALNKTVAAVDEAVERFTAKQFYADMTQFGNKIPAILEKRRLLEAKVRYSSILLTIHLFLMVYLLLFLA
jgi:hypothetical protein